MFNLSNPATLKTTSASARYTLVTRDGQLKLRANPSPHFSRMATSPSLMPLPSVLKTIKINGSVECSWCMKNSRLSTSIWSITAGSNVSSTLGRYTSCCDNGRRAIHKCRSVTQEWISRLSQMIMQHIFAYNGLPWPRDLHF